MIEIVSAPGAVVLRKAEPLASFSKSLQNTLHRAMALANERNHEYATLEHLLLALIDDQDATAVMRACNVDVDALRAHAGDLCRYGSLDADRRRRRGREADGRVSNASCSAPSSMCNRRAAKK